MSDDDFADILDNPGEGDDEPKEEPKEDEPKEEEPKEDEPKEDEPKEDEPKEDKKATLDDDLSEDLGGAKNAENVSTLEFPEDSVLSEEIQQDFSKLVDSINIDDETLGEVGDLLERATSEGYEVFREQFMEEQNARKEAITKDPLFAEGVREKTWGNIQEVAKRYGDDRDALSTFFNSYHSLDPSLMRLLNNVGEALRSNPEFGGATANMPSGKSKETGISDEYGAMLD